MRTTIALQFNTKYIHITLLANCGPQTTVAVELKTTCWARFSAITLKIVSAELICKNLGNLGKCFRKVIHHNPPSKMLKNTHTNMYIMAGKLRLKLLTIFSFCSEQRRTCAMEEFEFPALLSLCET